MGIGSVEAETQTMGIGSVEAETQKLAAVEHKSAHVTVCLKSPSDFTLTKWNFPRVSKTLPDLSLLISLHHASTQKPMPQGLATQSS